MATRRKSSPTRAKPVPRITSPAATAECGGRFMATTTGHTVKAFDDDLDELRALISQMGGLAEAAIADAVQALARKDTDLALRVIEGDKKRSEEHTSELQSLMRISYAVFCLKKKKRTSRN